MIINSDREIEPKATDQLAIRRGGANKIKDQFKLGTIVMDYLWLGHEQKAIDLNELYLCFIRQSRGTPAPDLGVEKIDERSECVGVVQWFMRLLVRRFAIMVGS